MRWSHLPLGAECARSRSVAAEHTRRHGLEVLSHLVDGLFRNRGIEQERLLEAATEALEKQPPAAETRQEEPQPVTVFEEKAEEDVFEFPCIKW